MNSSESKADTTAPLREIEFSETDTLLRADVRRLGAMVGQMLAEQQSPAFLEQVESVRRMSIARRGNAEPVAPLAACLAAVPTDHATVHVRQLSAYSGAHHLGARMPPT